MSRTPKNIVKKQQIWTNLPRSRSWRNSPQCCFSFQTMKNLYPVDQPTAAVRLATPDTSAPAKTTETWSPTDWLRLVALIGAFVLFGLGSWMLFKGIVAEGTVDLKSSLLSGSLKASSAGLFICFFAIFIMSFVLVPLLVGRKATERNRPHSRVARLMPVFWGLLIAQGLTTIASVLLPEGSRTGFIMATGALGPAFIAVVVMMLRMANEDDA